MEILLLWALVAALVSPLFWALSNITDKYIVAHKVRNTKSFVAVVASVYLIFGMGIALFLDWKGIGFMEILFPAVSGITLGMSILVYYTIMQKEDPSQVIGLVYVYPLLVALLSFFFLNERLSILGYIGAALAVFGALLISARLKEIKLKTKIWMLLLMIACSAFYEFFLKIAAVQLPLWHGVAINEFFIGLTALLILLRKDARKGFLEEVTKIKWAFLSEGSILIGITLTYISLIKLPVAFVSSVAVTQPLLVLIFEFYTHRYFGKMSRDPHMKKKAIAIVLMVLGIILLYLAA